MLQNRSLVMVVTILLVGIIGGVVAWHYDYPVPSKFIVPYTKTTLNRWFAKENEPLDVSLIYLTKVLSGDSNGVANFVVSEGREEALQQAQENKAYFDSYGLSIKLIHFEPTRVNILSPDEVVFEANVRLLVSSPYRSELETFRWGVALVREDQHWKVASADVFDRETEIIVRGKV